MNTDLRDAAQSAVELLGVVGRASTPPVIDRQLPIRTHDHDPSNDHDYPVAVIGDAESFKALDIPIVETHPNSIDQVMAVPAKYQALLVNGRDMKSPWQGAETGSAGWKSELIYQACSQFRIAGVPVYVIQPTALTTPFLRWKSLASATFPGFNDESENTGNPHTKLWAAITRMDDDK